MADISQPGRIVIGASRLGTVKGVAGQGTIAYVEVEALAEGRAVIKCSECKVLDRNLKSIKPLSRRKAVVIVGPPGGVGQEEVPDGELPDGETSDSDQTSPQSRAVAVLDT